MVRTVLVEHFGLTKQAAPREILELGSLSKYGRHIPHVAVSHDDDPHWRKPEELIQTKNRYRQNKVIFLVRDPRDVIVSWYFQMTKRLTDDPNYRPRRVAMLRGEADRMTRYKGDLSTFNRRDVGGFESIIRFYNIWAKNRDVPRRFLLVKYEHLHKDTLGILKCICEFIDLTDVPNETLERAVASTSFDNMRQLEADNTFRSFILRPGDVKDIETYKMRRGKIGGYKDYMNEEDMEYVNKIMRETLSPYYGYTVL